MQAHVSKHHGLVDLLALMVGAMLIGLLFVLCLQLLQVREVSGTVGSATVVGESAAVQPSASMPTPPASDGTSQPATYPIHNLAALAGTRVGLTMTCVLLAGAIGGYLRYVRERFGEIALDQRRDLENRELPVSSTAEEGLVFASRLIIGLCSASVAALFIPLAIADPPGLNIYNPWGLLMLAVGAGYQSSTLFGGLQAQLERIFTEIRRAESIDEKTVTSAAKQGVLDALGAPAPINFDGKVSLGVVMSHSGLPVLPSDDPPGIELAPNASYAARIVFRPNGAARTDKAGDAATEQRIRIQGGVDAESIPFDLQMLWTNDLSNDPKAVARSIAFSRTTAEHLEDFEFTVPPKRQSLDGPPSEITLFVRQHGLVCAVVSLPVRLQDLT